MIKSTIFLHEQNDVLDVFQRVGGSYAPAQQSSNACERDLSEHIVMQGLLITKGRQLANRDRLRLKQGPINSTYKVAVCEITLRDG